MEWGCASPRTLHFITMLRKIRLGLGLIMLAAITFLFVDVSGWGATHLNRLAHIQFLPSLLEGSLITVAVLLLITLLFGRIYCSVICPLGLLQDAFAHLGLKAKPRRYSFSKEKRVLRLAVAAVFVAALAAGLGSLVALLAPYSSFGRIAQNVFQPVYQSVNNLLAYGAEAAGSYAFSATDVWVRTWPTFAISIVTLIVIGVLAWRNGRTYCNTICPVGTLLGYVSKFSLFAPVIDNSRCVGCRMCERNCKAACINALKSDDRTPHIDTSRCVACFNCIDNCKRGAIHYKARWRMAPHATQSGGDTPDGARRSFLTGLGILAVSAAQAQKEKVVDGGLTILEDKKPARRATDIVPPGAVSLRHFSRHCTGCQLCVAQCPNNVLRPSTDLASLMQPRMSYERGFCRPECNVCSQVCPTGAIRPIDLPTKSSTQIGHAMWVADRCVVNTDGVSCGNCARHCPNGAIAMVKSQDNPELRIPAVNEARCIGCGACEHVCPSRPLSAIFVEGHENHKEI